MESSANNIVQSEMVGSDTNHHEQAEEAQMQDPTTNNDIPTHSDRVEEPAQAKHVEDDSGEVVMEDKEDTVIY